MYVMTVGSVKFLFLYYLLSYYFTCRNRFHFTLTGNLVDDVGLLLIWTKLYIRAPNLCLSPTQQYGTEWFDMVWFGMLFLPEVGLSMGKETPKVVSYYCNDKCDALECLILLGSSHNFLSPNQWTVLCSSGLTVLWTYKWSGQRNGVERVGCMGRFYTGNRKI